MKIQIEVTEQTKINMYHQYCETQLECSDCCCNVLINEDYENCKEKYIKLFLKDEIEKKINVV